MAGESDSENQIPKVETECLSDYKTIFHPIQLPSKREQKDANRCRKSGMVPGAFRKYLIQKKKQEVDDEEEEEEISDSGSNTHCPGPSNNNNKQTGRKVHDDDEIHIIGEYPSSIENVLVDISVRKSRSRQVLVDAIDNGENDPLDSEETEFSADDDTSRDSALEAKRIFSEAFSEPDSTTPDDLQLNPEKRQKLERTPVSQKETEQDQRNGIEDNCAIPGTSEGLRSRRRKSSNSIEDVNEKGSWVRNIFPETLPSSTFIQAPENAKLENSIKKNDWKTILIQFEDDLKNKLIPTPNHLGDLIRKAILSLGTRVSKDVPALAAEYFRTLVRSYPIDCDESTDYYLSAFTKSSTDSCTMPGFLFVVLEGIQADAQAKVPPKALPFFKSLTKMVVNQYKSYTTSSVKLRRPFFVRFLEEKDKILSYNFYCQKLLTFMFALKDYPAEFKAVMRWVGLLSYHLGRNIQLDSHLQTLVRDFVNTVSKREFSHCKIKIIQSISDKPLGAAVCLQLLQKNIKFKTVDRDSDPMQEDVILFLRKISQSELIAGLKSGLQERKSEDFGPVVSFPFPLGKKSKKEGVNMKGESYLHRLCRKAPINKKNNAGLKLDKFLREKRFPVNPIDNFGNTPLHDAIAHERFDALTKFFEYCSDPSLPDELRVNLLAQNGADETPFHLAASSTLKSGDQMVEMLRWMADKLQVTDEALKILNHEGKMPYQLAFTQKARSLLKPNSIKELPYEVENVKVDIPSRTALQSIDVKRLIALWSEFSSVNE